MVCGFCGAQTLGFKLLDFFRNSRSEKKHGWKGKEASFTSTANIAGKIGHTNT